MAMRDEARIDGFSKELKMLLILLETRPEAQTRERMEQWRDQIDWDEWLQLVWYHRVYPLVYKRLRELNIEWVPEEVMKQLYMKYSQNTFQMLRLTREMEKLCLALREQNIPSLMLKGPVLAHLLYGDVSLRTSKDMDILVPIEDVEKAEKVLVELGYILTEDVKRILKDWKWRSHHLLYVHPQTKVQIELHWRLNPDTLKEPLFSELWERRQSSLLTSSKVYCLGRDDLFLYLMSHGARHGWFRIRWLVDMDRFLRIDHDRGYLIEMIKEYQYAQIAGQMLNLTSLLLGTLVPRDMRCWREGRYVQKLTQKSLQYIQHQLMPKRDLKSRLYLFSLLSTKQKWIYLFSRLMPNSYDAEVLPLPKSLHFLYFPLRPFLWFWRRMKNQASS
ncbi:nucleotidyltransferase family protein [Marinicrinis lubricantis]|uniref:Nucleotidyltransferase family protein n=1 Tax=Marinicrinis lubricantis TaxID=2086470 RepID=A0ABW1IJU2_9BACL